MKNEATNAAQTTLVSNGLVPMGTIVPFLLSSDYVPTGWLLCDGSAIPDEYQDLNNALGGHTPNLAGLTLIGGGTSVVNNGYPQNWMLNQTGGEYENVLTETQIPSHQHYGWGEKNTGDNWANWNGNIGYSTECGFAGSQATDWDNYLFGSTFAGGDYSGIATVSTTNGSVAGTAKGSTLPHNNMQPYYVVNYIIYTGVNS